MAASLTFIWAHWPSPFKTRSVIIPLTGLVANLSCFICTETTRMIRALSKSSSASLDVFTLDNCCYLSKGCFTRTVIPAGAQNLKEIKKIKTVLEVVKSSMHGLLRRRRSRVRPDVQFGAGAAVPRRPDEASAAGEPKLQGTGDHEHLQVSLLLRGRRRKNKTKQKTNKKHTSHCTLYKIHITHVVRESTRNLFFITW